MVQGMTDLHSSNPSRYKLGVLSDDAAPPSSTTAGTVYEYNRGNPGWSAKLSQFVGYVNGGWKSPKVQFAMDKFCYIDQDANATAYLNGLAGLETANPTTKIVYCTIPLMTSEDGDNILRNNFNDAVRTYCIANNKLLYDIADMEAHNPSGVESTFTSGGKTYQKLYSGYSSDGGHLNTAGAQQIAKGWYAVCVYGTRFVTFNKIWSGLSSNSWGTVGNWATTGGNAFVPDAPGITVTLGMPGANSTIALDATGRTVGGLTMLADVSTTVSGTATLTLDNNGKPAAITASGTHNLSAGVYFKDDLQVGGGGTVNFSGSLSGDASKTFTVLEGTTVNLVGAANGIGNSIAVYGQLNAASLNVPTLTIGGTHVAQAVPEPSAIALIATFAALAALGLRKKLAAAFYGR
jgi:hypothetical protein